MGVLAGSPTGGGRGLSVVGVDAKREVSEFLTSRRGRITPEQVGLPVYGSRRVPGLRREEVAVLAGVSVPYYTRLERGDLSGVSDGVLAALARALQLDDAERSHLLDLARSAQPSPAVRRRRAKTQAIRPNVQWLLDSMAGAAAAVFNARHDLLAANQLGRALFSPMYDGAGAPPNMLRFMFLNPAAVEKSSASFAMRCGSEVWESSRRFPRKAS